jgi:hypothetical protein
MLRYVAQIPLILKGFYFLLASRRDMVATRGGILPMTDEQWSAVSRRLKVPDAAREQIENELDLYRRFACATASPPSETRKNLEQAVALASTLLEVIEGFGPDEHRALVESVESVTLSDISALPIAPEVQLLVDRPRKDLDPMWIVPARASAVGITPRIDALKLLVDQHARLTAPRDRMATAAAKIGRGKTGSDPRNVRALLKRVSEIVETHIGRPLSKGKREFDFAVALCKLADPQISTNSIKGAIEDLEPKLPAENSAKSG